MSLWPVCSQRSALDPLIEIRREALSIKYFSDYINMLFGLTLFAEISPYLYFSLPKLALNSSPLNVVSTEFSPMKKFSIWNI